MRTMWLANRMAAPVARTSATGFVTGRRVVSFSMRKTFASGRPAASPSGQPVIVSATEFM